MTKVTLSNTEKNLVLNQDVFLTKNEVIKKVYLLFNNVHEFCKEEINQFQNIPIAIKNSNGKISKGENYLLLPWAMLDAPNYFKGDDVFAIRTFFWWGNFISINFLVMGCFVDEVKKELFIKKSNFKDWSICINESPWQHHFKEDNMMNLERCTNEQLNNLSFIKIAKKIPLQEWDNVEIFLQENLQQLFGLFSNINFQVCEKVLLFDNPKAE